MRTLLPAEHHVVPEQAKRVFSGVIFDVYQWEQTLFDGTTATFEMLKRPDTIEVMAIKDNKLVVLKELQPGFDKPRYTLPGGRHDVETENELDAAQREVLEETGMTFENWRLLRIVQPLTKLDWFVYLYVATGFIDQTEQNLDAGEQIDIELMDYEKALSIAKNDKTSYLPPDLLEQAGSIEGIATLPEFKG